MSIEFICSQKIIFIRIETRSTHPNYSITTRSGMLKTISLPIWTLLKLHGEEYRIFPFNKTMAPKKPSWVLLLPPFTLVSGPAPSRRPTKTQKFPLTNSSPNARKNTKRNKLNQSPLQFQEDRAMKSATTEAPAKILVTETRTHLPKTT